VTKSATTPRRTETAGRRLAGLVLLVAVTAGCTLFEEKEQPPPCPRVSVLAETAKVVKFSPGPGRDLIDVIYEGTMADVQSECGFRTAGAKSKGNLSMDIGAVIEVTRGPANKDGRALFEYFVTITDTQRRILNKKTFQTGAIFPENSTRLILTDDPVNLSIPITGGQTGDDFLVFVGFQLSAEELRYNQKQHTGGR
jgi:hypothetical protein